MSYFCKLKVRLWMKGISYKRRRSRPHKQWRERKQYCGEMIQMDGSEHDWLEGRGPKLVLMGCIDDATGNAFARFYPYEGTIPAMDSFKRYIKAYGPPQAEDGKHYHIEDKVRAKDVTVEERIDGSMLITHKDRLLKHKDINKAFHSFNGGYKHTNK